MSYTVIYKKTVLEGRNGRKYPILTTTGNVLWLEMGYINYKPEDLENYFKKSLYHDELKEWNKWLDLDLWCYWSLKYWSKCTAWRFVKGLSKTTYSLKEFENVRIWKYDKSIQCTLKDLDNLDDASLAKINGGFFVSVDDFKDALYKTLAKKRAKA